jgi:hypothetical protein
MVYVAMKSLRSIKLLWWKLPHDPAADLPTAPKVSLTWALYSINA